MGKIFLKERGGKLVIKGGIELSGEIPKEQYYSLMERYPQLADQFETVEEVVVFAKTTTKA